MKQSPQKQTKNSDLGISITLALVCAALYGRAVFFDFINLRDTDFITDNPHIRSGFTLDGLRWAFKNFDVEYAPFARILDMLVCQLFGLQSGMHHALNILLHATVCILLFLVLKRATGAQWPSAFVALVFAVNPLEVGSVAWISQRGTELAAIFCLLVLWISARWARIGLLICALLASPEVAGLWMVLTLLFEYWPLQRFSRNFSELALMVPGFLVWAINFAHPRADFWSALVPIDLTIPHPTAPLWQWILFAAVAIGVGLVLWRIGRRPLFAGWVWFVAGFFVSPYFAIVGIAIMLAWTLVDMNKPVALGIATVACAAWGAVTWIELGYWQNSTTLFERAIEKNPTNYAALDRLGDTQRREGHLPEALANLESAIKLRPDDPRVNRDYGNALSAAERPAEAIAHLQSAVRATPKSAAAHRDLATAYESAEQFHEAELEFREAVRLDPGLADARAGIGFTLADQGKMADAKPFIESSVAALADAARLLPDDAYAHMNLGRADNFLGRGDDAIAELSTAVHLHPDDPEPHFQLGIALAQRGRYNEAFAQLGPAERLAPDSPKIHFRLADSLFQLGRRVEALTHLDHVVKLRPDYPGGREARDMVERIVYGK